MKNADCPAFPCQLSGINAYGMTKREFFAAMAMQGLMDAAARQEIDDMNMDSYARLAFSVADAMLAQEAK